jgi:hypothetical protein
MGQLQYDDHVDRFIIGERLSIDADAFADVMERTNDDYAS